MIYSNFATAAPLDLPVLALTPPERVAELVEADLLNDQCKAQKAYARQLRRALALKRQHAQTGSFLRP